MSDQIAFATPASPIVSDQIASAAPAKTTMERADGTMGTLAAVAIILFHPLDILLHRPTIATFA
jgi:hypothetical protein